MDVLGCPRKGVAVTLSGCRGEHRSRRPAPDPCRLRAADTRVGRWVVRMQIGQFWAPSVRHAAPDRGSHRLLGSSTIFRFAWHVGESIPTCHGAAWALDECLQIICVVL